MTITFVSSAERRTWIRLLELDGERCWQRAQRRQAQAQRRRGQQSAGAAR